MLYYPLHVHSAFGSIGDSTLRIEEYVKKAREYGLTRLALTDHGSLAAIYKFREECLENDIAPIYGCEVYVAASGDRMLKDNNNKAYYHLILLAKTNEGFSNLLSIVNDANINGFYYRPRTDMAMLKKYGKGIIALSACIAGAVPQAILNNDKQKAITLIQEHKEIFDEFYLELQPGDFTEQLAVNTSIISLATITNTSLVISNDIHYLHKDDALIHNLHVKINRKGKDDDLMVYPDTCYWFMDTEAILQAFESQNINPYILQAAIKNTQKIAESCNVIIDTTVRMPQFPLDKHTTEAEALTAKCFAKFEELKYSFDDPALHMDRLLYELETIIYLGFAGYFLIVEDLVQYAKRTGIPVGPGRGSVAGSLVSFLLGITTPNPLKYNLSFERFLSKHRTSPPDNIFLQ